MKKRQRKKNFKKLVKDIEHTSEWVKTEDPSLGEVLCDLYSRCSIGFCDPLQLELGKEDVSHRLPEGSTFSTYVDMPMPGTGFRDFTAVMIAEKQEDGTIKYLSGDEIADMSDEALVKGLRDRRSRLAIDRALRDCEEA